MRTTEKARLVLYLQERGWDEKKINDLILYLATGEEQYKPRPGRKTD